MLATVTWELGVGGLASALSCRKLGAGKPLDSISLTFSLSDMFQGPVKQSNLIKHLRELKHLQTFCKFNIRQFDDDL